MNILRIAIALSIVGGFVIAGCGADSTQQTPSKEAFKKRPPPPEWRGPGQPGAPGGAPPPPPAGSMGPKAGGQ